MLPGCLLRRAGLLVGTAAWSIAYAADIPAQLTLPEALNIALTNSTVLREAMAQLDQASGQYLQSRSALLPQVGIFARQSLQTISLQGQGPSHNLKGVARTVMACDHQSGYIVGIEIIPDNHAARWQRQFH